MTLQILNKTADDVQAIIDRSAFLSWLGLKVLSLGEDTIEVEATWRPEWVANPVVGQTQGGIHAALIDFAANLAMINKIGGPVLTIDLRVDYHRVVKKGNLIARGKVIKFGRTIGTSEAQIFDGEGRLIASGRGSFQTTQTSEAGARSNET
ncbi:PaaI family thioesterase (plasmid) [Rhizobium sp. TRM96647]|uniref:PaaI family thioesterase n=1 Tax=unclassified Rhizobium TaxID=2613769 RepID=UPI0021E75F36|nr:MULTISPECIES: PaaI family thioesterase [unclassified Rhizobium]MCV3735196.1 PaaI family thioesterase [Rhizobium sp. TRM96647]MCV3758041.1 PaaI family thioesterase [Rhizobium sp. TRM96650]